MTQPDHANAAAERISDSLTNAGDYYWQTPPEEIIQSAIDAALRAALAQLTEEPMRSDQRWPAQAFPVGEYIAEELEARGWTTAYAAKLIEGDPAVNELWLDLLCCPGIWEEKNILFSDDEAEKIAKLFGTEKQTWLNLHAAYKKATAHERN